MPTAPPNVSGTAPDPDCADLVSDPASWRLFSDQDIAAGMWRYHVTS